MTEKIKINKIESKKELKEKTGTRISLKMLFIIEFIVVASVVFGLATEVQNRRLRNLILNYDKSKEVYSLQQDFKGGNY